METGDRPYQCRIIRVPQQRTQFWLRPFLTWRIYDILAYCNMGHKAKASVDDRGRFLINGIQVNIDGMVSKRLMTSMDSKLFLLIFRDANSCKRVHDQYYAKLQQYIRDQLKYKKRLPELPSEKDEECNEISLNVSGSEKFAEGYRNLISIDIRKAYN